uniref:ATP synthase subunit d, mitochondrial n=1 Tax=Caligus rogercresseyi TaxID=217165 RepID=C1BQX2_CALRO|nr:ATP synthase subunit d, mitochondrial [Caligus rogercresseyi]
MPSFAPSMHSPQSFPKFDFAMYRGRIAVPGMVDNFEKQWGALKVPFPADNVSSGLEAEAGSAKSKYDSFVAESNSRKVGIEAERKSWESMLPIEEMNREEALEAVPWLSIDVKNPTHFPHESKKIDTIDLDAHFGKKAA